MLSSSSSECVTNSLLTYLANSPEPENIVDPSELEAGDQKITSPTLSYSFCLQLVLGEAVGTAVGCHTFAHTYHKPQQIYLLLQGNIDHMTH
jgi:hypothetical protein